MLARPHRLTRARDIRQVLRSGRSRRGKTLLVRFVPHTGATARFAVVVSTKVSKKATVRNRLKRQIRDLLKRHLQRFPGRNDYLVSVVPQTPLPTYHDLQHDINALLSHS